jgi:predicted NBD/HSP70 family sugar kinase
VAVLPEKATHQQTRTFNQQLVLRAIYDRNETSRAELARLTGLTRTSVSALVGELLRDGLIEEVGTGPSTGGKAPILLRVRPDGRHTIGIDLTEPYFAGALVDLRGHIIHSVRLPLEGRDGMAAVEVVMAVIEELANRNGRASLLGIGIGAPGIVNSRDGTIRWGVNLDWADVPLGAMVEQRYGLPAVVVNDSQAAAVAEFTFGTPPRPNNMVVVRVGRGIGSGIILDGRLYQGDGAGAGEIGHTTYGAQELGASAERCRCGRVGCLEMSASMHAMVSAAGHLEPSVTDSNSLVAALNAGNENVRRIVTEAGHRLGQAIAALISVLNVNLVLLIGAATRLGDVWLDAVRESAATGALQQLTAATRIELGAARDEDDVLVGASAMLMTRELGLSLIR